ncbi:MAG: HEAT repeat domain-containing protein, partial [Cyanobacteriota bacterium SKYGB_h_bin112]|nr:HEAT repeat domain-containing protein [Cyanobacteriota bacterium SKYGB_h_bin112]
MMATNVVSYTVGASLFLNREGSSALPLYNLMLGLAAIPVSIGISIVIDRYSRLRLYQLLLTLGILAIGLQWELLPDTEDFYTLYISLNLMELLTGILFWTLVADYFTSLEFRQYTPLLTMAMTMGGIIGGSIVHIASQRTETMELLLMLPWLYGLAIVQLAILENSETPLAPETIKPDAFLVSLRTFPKLLSRYPIILLLAIGTFVSSLLWQLGELEFSQIYTNAITDEQDLTSFLGLLSAGFSVLELALTGLVTRLLIKRLDAGALNLVYPLTTLVSFVGLAINSWLPAAVLININHDPLYSSLAQPIQNLNYNAVPHRFVGRVRVMIDGLVYPLSQVVVGIVLFQLQSSLALDHLSWVGIGFSLVAVGIGYLTGKSYLYALMTRLHAGSVNLSDMQLVRLPTGITQDIYQLLTSDEPRNQILGLELAGRIDNPAQFLDQLQQLLLRGNATVRLAVVMLLSSRQHPEFDRFLRTQLVSDHAEVREAVLEALIRSQQPISDAQLYYFLEDPSPSVRALACVATRQSNHASAEVWAAYNHVWRLTGKQALNQAARRAVIRAIGGRSLSDSLRSRLLPLLEQVLINADSTVKQEGLTALASLARPGDTHLAKLAIAELTHPHAQVRAAAVKLLAVMHDPLLLPILVKTLNDSDIRVRQQATIAIACYQELAIPVVQPCLSSAQLEVVEAAIAILGQIKTKQAEDLLYQHLQAYYQHITLSLSWQQRLLTQLPGWSVLAITLDDYRTQLINRVFYVLACLGYESTINTVRRLLRSDDVRQRANAIETLASLPHRRFVQPILPILSQSYSVLQPNREIALHNGTKAGDDRLASTLIQEILTTCKPTGSQVNCTDIGWRSRWVRIGAFMTSLTMGDS